MKWKREIVDRDGVWPEVKSSDESTSQNWILSTHLCTFQHLRVSKGKVNYNSKMSNLLSLAEKAETVQFLGAVQLMVTTFTYNLRWYTINQSLTGIFLNWSFLQWRVATLLVLVDHKTPTSFCIWKWQLDIYCYSRHFLSELFIIKVSLILYEYLCIEIQYQTGVNL